MKTTRALVVGGLAVAVGLAVAGWMIFKQSAPQEIARADAERVAAPEPRSNPTPPAVPPTPTPDPSPAEQTSHISGSAPPPQTAKKDAAPKVAPQSTPTKKPKEPLQDPMAREAMALVGVDAKAEVYWLEAINDPSLSNNEREDLIEDLNENGFSGENGRRATVADLPLIERRLWIIEELWPDAMDQNNWNAFQEVHKDLTNMRDRLLQE